MRDPLAPSRIVCAAMRFPDGTIVVGPRHWDQTMRATADRLGLIEKRRSGLEVVGSEEQGFIDQHGKFFTRQEAWKIAEANRQIYRRCGGDDAHGGTLYSENLY